MCGCRHRVGTMLGVEGYSQEVDNTPFADCSFRGQVCKISFGGWFMIDSGKYEDFKSDFERLIKIYAKGDK